MTKRRKWLLATGGVTALGLIILISSMLTHSGSEYLNVSEVNSQATPGQQLKVEGTVMPGSVNWDAEAQVTRFFLTDTQESLSVVYRGIVPDYFKPGSELTIEGSYGSDGIFEAQSFISRGSFCTFCHR